MTTTKFSKEVLPLGNIPGRGTQVVVTRGVSLVLLLHMWSNRARHMSHDPSLTNWGFPVLKKSWFTLYFL